jgi:hypothetical protein
MSASESALDLGVRNLLQECAQAEAGQSLLIVEEAGADPFYEAALGDAIWRGAERLGLRVRRHAVPFDARASELPGDLADLVAGADHTLFLARIGDQLRFSAMPRGSRPIVSYVLDRARLASPLGAASYRAFVSLKRVTDALFAAAEEVRVTCPLGTDFVGSARQPAMAPGQAGDVTIKRFPMTIFAPQDARGFTGRVAVAHGLAGTGSRYYQPYGLRLAQAVVAIIADNRIVQWEGAAGDVAAVKAHYRMVANGYGIDADFVHSWHAGIHPACTFAGHAFDDLERWSASAFGNPRLLHFHTCGAYAPGEICWNVLDPTIVVDGVTVWQSGRLLAERIPDAAAILAEHPEVARLFAEPLLAVGL